MRDQETQFKAIIESHKDRIYRICCCYVRNDNERKDVFQDVLIHIWESLHTFEGRSEIGTWIYRITVNTCLGYLRTEKRRKRLFDETSRPAPDEIPDYAAGDGPQHTEDEVQHLYRCINELQPIDKALISLSLEEVSTKQMAEIIGISEVNVRVKLHRIKKNLKDTWERTQYGSE